MATFRTVSKDDSSLPFVFQSAQSGSDDPLVALSFQNKDTGQIIYDMASVGIYDTMPHIEDGFGAIALSTASNGAVTEVARVTDANRFGLNTSAPLAELHVVGTTNLTSGQVTFSNGRFEAPSLSVSGTGSLVVNGQPVAPGGGGGGASGFPVDNFSLAGDGTLVTTTDQASVFVSPDGNVGIQTPDATAPLVVSGKISAAALAVADRAAIGQTASDPAYALVISGDSFIDGNLVVTAPVDARPYFRYEDDRLAFLTSGIERAAVDPRGDAAFFESVAVRSNVGVGGDAALVGIAVEGGVVTASNSLAVATLEINQDASAGPVGLVVSGHSRVDSASISAGSFLVASGDVTVASGRVGVSTTPLPGAALAIGGNASGATATVTGGNVVLSGGDLRIASGSVGVRTSPSSAFALDVAGDARLEGRLELTGHDLIVQSGAVSGRDVALDSSDLALSNGELGVLSGRVIVGSAFGSGAADLDITGTARVTGDVDVSSGDVVVSSGSLIAQTGSIGVRTAPSNDSAVHVNGDARADGSVFVGGASLPQSGADDKVLAVGDGDSLRWVDLRTDTVDASLTLLSAGPSAATEAGPSAADYAVFERIAYLDADSFRVGAGGTEATVEASAAPVLLLCVPVVGMTVAVDQAVTCRLNLSPFGQLGTDAVVGSRAAGYDLSSAAVGAFARPAQDQTVAFNAQRTFDAGGGDAFLDPETRFHGLAFARDARLFHAQSLGIAAAQTGALAPLALTDVKAMDGDLFSTAVAGGFSVSSDSVVFVFGSVSFQAGGRGRVQLQVNGAAVGGTDFYSPLADSGSGVSVAHVLSVSAGDQVRLVHSTYLSYAATVTGVSLSACTVDPDRCLQVTAAVPATIGVPIFANTFFTVPFLDVGVSGSPYTTTFNTAEVAADGLYFVCGNASFRKATGGDCGVLARVQLDGSSTVAAGFCCVDGGTTAATVFYGNLVQLVAGNVLSVEISCNQLVFAFNATLTVVRYDPAYADPAPVLVHHGSHYHRAELQVPTINASTAFADAFTLVTGVLPAERYRVCLDMVLSRLSNQTGSYRVLLNGETVVISAGTVRVPGNAGSSATKAETAVVMLPAGSHRLALQTRTLTGNPTWTVERAHLELFGV